jgi:hypothetical protein
MGSNIRIFLMFEFYFNNLFLSMFKVYKMDKAIPTIGKWLYLSTKKWSV